MSFWRLGPSMPWWQRVLAVPVFCGLGAIVFLLLSLACYAMLSLALTLLQLSRVGTIAGSVCIGVGAGIASTIGLLIFWPDFRPWLDGSTKKGSAP